VLAALVGLIDASNGMSGERLRVMIVRASWIVTVVRTWRGVASPISGSGSRAQPSSTATRFASRKRLSGLNVAPRPRLGPAGGQARGDRSPSNDCTLTWRAAPGAPSRPDVSAYCG
jgi:hypothetical protein